MDLSGDQSTKVSLETQEILVEILFFKFISWKLKEVWKFFTQQSLNKLINLDILCQIIVLIFEVLLAFSFPMQIWMFVSIILFLKAFIMITRW